jgi:hypothetical protein
LQSASNGSKTAAIEEYVSFIFELVPSSFEKYKDRTLRFAGNNLGGVR